MPSAAGYAGGCSLGGVLLAALVVGFGAAVNNQLRTGTDKGNLTV